MKRSALPLGATVLLSLALAACPKGGDRVVNVGDFKGGGDETPASNCADDPREEDDEVAYVLSKTTKDGEKFDAMSCPGDDDFIHLFSEGRTGATITWNPADGDLRVDLLDKSGAQIRLGSTDFAESSNGRVIVQKQGARGDFFLRIRNRAGTPAKYRVEVGFTQSDIPAPPPSIVTQTPTP